ncbi:PhoU domain-containing protein [candidate division KSB1 bacterium]
MRRKLVKQGRNALTTTLPAEWTSKHNLGPGDEVFVEDRDDSLMISAVESKGGDKKNVDVSGLDPMIKRVLGAIYKAGYDEAEVVFENSKELETAQEVIREEFIGFEVTHHGKNSLVFKNISTIDAKEFNTMMRRMFLIIKSMGEDCADAVKKNDYDFMKAIILRDKDVNKIADFCRRSLNSSGHLIEGRAPPLYFIAEQLEKIGDIYRDICKLFVKDKINLSAETLPFFSEANSFFGEFYKLYFDFDLKKMAEFGKKRYLLVDKIEKLIEAASKKEMPVIFYLRNIIENTFDMNGPLMAAKL